MAGSNNGSLGFENGVDVVGACCNSSVADVEAKISGSNVVLKIISRRIPGQLSKMIGVFERLSFEVLHLNISSMDDTVLYSFVVKVYYIKIGLTLAFLLIRVSFLVGDII